MSLGTMLYLATVSDKIGFIAEGLSIILTFIVIISIFSAIANKELLLKNTIASKMHEKDSKYYEEKIKVNEVDLKITMSILRPAVTILTISVLIAVFLPKSKDLYIIYGTTVVEDVVKSPKVQETGGKVLDLINKKLSELSEK